MTNRNRESKERNIIKWTEYKKTVQPSYTEGYCQMRADCSQNSQGYHNNKKKRKQKDTKEKGECAREEKRREKRKVGEEEDKIYTAGTRKKKLKTAHSMKIQFFFFFSPRLHVFSAVTGLHMPL